MKWDKLLQSFDEQIQLQFFCSQFDLSGSTYPTQQWRREKTVTQPL
jgi:hypothetical protein